LAAGALCIYLLAGLFFGFRLYRGSEPRWGSVLRERSRRAGHVYSMRHSRAGWGRGSAATSAALSANGATRLLHWAISSSGRGHKDGYRNLRTEQAWLTRSGRRRCSRRSSWLRR